jgi:translation initiation factor 1
MFTYEDNVNSIEYALKELDKSLSNIFVYTDIKKFNKPITIIQGLKDKDLIRTILRELKKKIGTGGTFKNGMIILHKVIIKNM